MPIKIAIVEDDDAVRRSLENILRRAASCEFVASCRSGEDALQELPQCRPQVVLMDISLPGMDGVECVRQLTKQMNEVRIVMLTVHEDPDAIFRSLAAGASGYLLKPVRTAELLEVVRDVFTGGAPMTSSIAAKVVQSFQQRASAPQSGTENLSPRELEVLDHLVKGFSYKEVSDALGISYGTVHKHIERIYQKLHVQSRAQAVARYLKI